LTLLVSYRVGDSDVNNVLHYRGSVVTDWLGHLFTPLVSITLISVSRSCLTHTHILLAAGLIKLHLDYGSGGLLFFAAVSIHTHFILNLLCGDTTDCPGDIIALLLVFYNQDIQFYILAA